ncbi:MAG: hypothetical protein ACRBN8_19230 [Nannocystales bacterium]
MKRVAALCTLVISGCSFFLPADVVRPRASAELECPAEEVTLTELEGRCGKMAGEVYHCTLMAVGCGKKTIYVHPEGGPWMRNGAIEAHGG